MIAMYLFACICCMLLQGFFAASEIAFISSHLLTLRHRQEQGDFKAGEAYRLMQNPERFLITTLIGTNVSLVLSSTFLTSLLIKLGIENSNLWAMIFFTPLVVIFAELVPKNIGRHYSENFSCAVVGVTAFFQRLFFFAVRSIEIVSMFAVKIFIGPVRKRSAFVTKEELKLLIKEVARQGGIDWGEQAAIQEVFEFRRDKVKDACMHMKKVAGLDYTDTLEHIQGIVRGSRFTRYPVFRDKKIVGFINIFDLFYNPDQNWHALIRPLMRVGINQNLHEVFTRLKSRKESMAVVIKGNKIYGIITLQDLIRQILISIVRING